MKLGICLQRTDRLGIRTVMFEFLKGPITFMSIIHQIYIDIWASLELLQSPLFTGLQPLQHPKYSKHSKKNT
jgi:hypothetical protein